MEPNFEDLEIRGVPARRTSRTFGLLGIVASILGLVISVAYLHVDEALQPPTPKIDDRIVEVADKFVGRMVDRARGKKAQAVVLPPKVIPWQWYLAVMGPGLGLIGSINGTVGWVRREDQRLAVSAMAVGFLAVAWTYILVALVIALVIVLTVLILGNIG